MELATEFGRSLDADDFGRFKTLLSPLCVYILGDRRLVGPEEIARSYEANMIEGRSKFDQLVWGASRAERVNAATFLIHFTDYLTHGGESHTFECRQRITYDDDQLVHLIEHIDDPEQQARLQAFYRRVGLS